MAIDPALYAKTQFRFAIQKETTLGTANVNTMQLLNIDGIPKINHGVERSLNIRHGAGRTTKNVDGYINQNGVVKEIPFSIYMDETTPSYLIENLIGKNVSSAPASFDIAYNYTPPETKVGDGNTDWTGGITCALISPEGSNTRILPGCVVDSLSIVANVGDDGGRFKLNGVFKSRCNISYGQAVPTSMDSYPTTYRTIYDLNGASAVKTIDAVDVVLNKFELNFVSGVQFYGSGVNGVPSVLARAIPEIAVNGLFGVKYDSNTASFQEKAKDETVIEVAIHNNVWASSTFGILGNYGLISEDVEESEVESGMFFDIPVKFTAHTSGNVIQIVP